MLNIAIEDKKYEELKQQVSNYFKEYIGSSFYVLYTQAKKPCPVCSGFGLYADIIEDGFSPNAGMIQLHMCVCKAGKSQDKFIEFRYMLRNKLDCEVNFE